MGKSRVQDLATMMGISNQDLVFKMKSLGVRVEGDDAHIDTENLQAFLQGKKLPHPREVILRDEQAPTAAEAARRRTPTAHHPAAPATSADADPEDRAAHPDAADERALRAAAGAGAGGPRLRGAAGRLRAGDPGARRGRGACDRGAAAGPSAVAASGAGGPVSAPRAPRGARAAPPAQRPALLLGAARRTFRRAAPSP